MLNLKALIQDLTLEEKVTLISGFDSWHTHKIERLNIPSIKMSDGPNGVRGNGNSGKSSACFPSPISIGSTWNLDLIDEIGKALGEESKLKDVDVLLGPTINIHRHPLGGRHFESYSEDPYLTGKIATAYVKGVQSKNVAACLKHFVANDTEFERHHISSNVDEKTLREIYLLPFEMGIKEGKAQVVMSAYNKLNKIYCSSHQELLIDILKTEWNFEGYVVSDWGAALETVENAVGGLDLEMPGPTNVWGEKLILAIQEGKVSESAIDDKVKRILQVATFSGRFQNPTIKPEESFDNPNHQDLIRKASAEGMVLLKNNGLLPLKNEGSNKKKLAVIGPNAKIAQIIGGGSASLKPHYVIHPLSAIHDKLDESYEIHYAKGCHTHKYLPKFAEDLMSHHAFEVKYFKDTDEGKVLHEEKLTGNKFWVFEGFGKDVINQKGNNKVFTKFSCSYRPNISGSHLFEIFGIGPCKLRIDGNELIDNWTSTEPGEAFFGFSSASKTAPIDLTKGKTYFIEIEYLFEGGFPAIHIGCLPPDPVNLFDEAVTLAKTSDEVILIVGTNADWETEGNDRKDFNLPANQDILIDAILEANPKTVVVLNTGSPVAMPWISQANAVIQSWFGGQEYGNALVDILNGSVNPSGKLPTTYPMRIEDTPAYNHYPGKDLQMDYAEKLLIGYRWYEKNNILPLFPFGHGLSYTEFKHSNLTISKNSDNSVTCNFEIENIGSVDGAVVTQCYIAFENAEVLEPIKRLGAFNKIFIKSKDTIKTEIKIPARSLAHWDIKTKSWVIRSGNYRIDLGISVADIVLQGQINYPQEIQAHLEIG